jgi:hypothetical protein
MSTSNESITAEPRFPAADDAPIPLPPVSKPPEVVHEEPGLRRRLARIDAALWGLVLLLAFLLGSFAATNSDLWMHLALGRDLLAGSYHFGVDPYSFTTNGVYWVNHSWLFDVVLYGLYSFLGGAGVVVLKALLVALTAGLLASLRRPEQSAWLPLCCTALAVLAMSPRLLLQPSLLSYLFLALTLFVLVRTSPQDVDAPAPARLSLWWLVPLFAVWANVDHWFWLGPLTVGLFTLGEWIQQIAPRRAGEAPLAPGRLKTLALVFGVGLLACVLNPHHVYVFTLPPELAQLVAGLPLPADFIAEGLALNRILEFDPLHPLRYYLLSPVSTMYFLPGSPGKTLAGLVFFPLFLLGVASFALSMRVGALRYWRLLLWTVLALLSLLQSRLIPYFAVAAAPITALNLQDFAALWTHGDLRVPRGWSIGGRLLTGLVLLVLAVLAWPGWLNPTGVASTFTARSPRRVAWRFEEDPSQKQAALALAELQKKGGLKNGFNYSADSAHYAAWYVPGYKGFFDNRFALFAGQAEAVGKIRREFQDETKVLLTRGTFKRDGSWRRIFPDKQINYVVLTGPPNVYQTRDLARRFYLDTKEWVTLYDDGQSTIVGWHGPRGDDKAFAKLPRPLGRDAVAAAFGPPSAAGPPLRSEVQAPQRAGVWLDFWGDYAHGLPNTPLAYSEAMQHLFYFEDTGGAKPRNYRWHTETLAKHLFQSPPGLGAWLGPDLAQALGVAAGLDLAARLASPSYFEAILAPAAHPYLALRDARRALAENPNDDACYLALAKAYAALADVEDIWRSGQPRSITELSLMDLRSVQIQTALNFALDLKPDNFEAREMLVHLYLRNHYFDAALEQFTELRDIVARRRDRGELLDAKKYETVQKNLEERYNALKSEVNARRSSYLLMAERLDLGKKFAATMLEPYRFQGPKGEPQQDPRGRGLILEAIKALRAADRDKLKKEEREALDARLVDLHLRMGRIRDMSELPNSKHVLEETPNSPRMLGLYLPAVGNYSEADKVFEILERGTTKDEKALAVLAGEALSNMLLAYQTNENWLKQLLEFRCGRPRQQIFAAKVNELRAELKRRTDLMLLRGMVALEQGDTDKALAQLRGCLRLTDLGEGFDAHRAAEAVFPDRPIAQRLVRLLESQRPK